MSHGVRKTLQQFVQEAQRVHGDKYTYDRTNYNNIHDKVVITCPKHGDFLQRAANHIHCASGCPQCSKSQRGNTMEKWLQLCAEKHGSTYDYTLMRPVNGRSVVTIICNEHGPFGQLMGSHIKGSGCPRCARDNSKMETEQWIAKAKERHGDLYSYDLVQLDSSQQKVEVVCKQHGSFWQTAYTHLRGGGCPRCFRRVSKPSVEWLEAMARLDNTYIEHGANGGEVLIPGTRWYADGFSAELNKVYEFHGDYYHGNPRRYAPDVFNKRCKRSMGELYEATRKRRTVLEGLGYAYEEIWEDEFEAEKHT